MADILDRDRIIGRILALQEKTEEAGATRAEAMLAAAKASELLHKYDLTMTDVELGATECGEETAEADAVGDPARRLVSAVARFSDTRAWHRQGAGSEAVVFFGLRKDAAVARYVYAICRRALAQETTGFAAGVALLRREVRAERVAEFRAGMAAAMAASLEAMAEERRGAVLAGGRDLVPVKMATVERELAARGFALRARRTVRRCGDAASRRLGEAAGAAVRFAVALEGEGAREGGPKLIAGGARAAGKGTDDAKSR